ncbi:MAG TPA: glutaredoxin domain-containing protein [Thermodesulfobacteriota bacterium]
MIYPQTGCSACKNTKEYLTQKGVNFEDRNVSEDERALKELTEKYKSRSTPAIIIGDEVIIGFDKEKLDRHIS